MILPFSEFFDKEKTKPTDFDDKICMALVDAGIEFTGVHETTPLYLEHVKTAKIHTIREDKKNRWKQGTKIHAVYNNRSNNQYQFAPTFKCTGIQIIRIVYPTINRVPLIWIDAIPMGSERVRQLAINDGFENIWDFFKYFNTDFLGKIIHFTDFRY